MGITVLNFAWNSARQIHLKAKHLSELTIQEFKLKQQKLIQNLLIVLITFLTVTTAHSKTCQSIFQSSIDPKIQEKYQSRLSLHRESSEQLLKEQSEIVSQLNNSKMVSEYNEIIIEQAQLNNFVLDYFINIQSEVQWIQQSYPNLKTHELSQISNQLITIFEIQKIDTNVLTQTLETRSRALDESYLNDQKTMSLKKQMGFVQNNLEPKQAQNIHRQKTFGFNQEPASQTWYGNNKALEENADKSVDPITKPNQNEVVEVHKLPSIGFINNESVGQTQLFSLEIDSTTGQFKVNTHRNRMGF